MAAWKPGVRLRSRGKRGVSCSVTLHWWVMGFLQVAWLSGLLKQLGTRVATSFDENCRMSKAASGHWRSFSPTSLLEQSIPEPVFQNSFPGWFWTPLERKAPHPLHADCPSKEFLPDVQVELPVIQFSEFSECLKQLPGSCATCLCQVLGWKTTSHSI